MVHELVFLVRGGPRSAQPVHHPGADSLPDPDIAVNDPDDISFRFSICAAHIPDLGIRSERVRIDAILLQEGIFIFDKNPCVNMREVGD